ncbi:MAG: glycosyltransferase family 9 protein [Gammaproteobacteria bacterium]
MSRILIIKLGALGDFFMAQPALRTLRAHHRHDELVLLTIPALESLAVMSGLFDEVWCDPRGRWPSGHWRMARRLAGGGFARIYDLQGTRRTAWYFRLMWPRRAPWAGPVAGCTWPRPPRPAGAHRADWYAAQLAALGITVGAVTDPDWLAGDLAGFALPPRYALIAAGGSAHRPGKRWPPAGYGSLARELCARDIVPVLIGTGIDAAANDTIAAQVPAAIDLTARTTIPQLASLARRAVGAVGNDTGPMHVIAATGCPAVVLYSAESDPGFVAPLGARVTCVQRPRLESLAAPDVFDAVRARWEI